MTTDDIVRVVMAVQSCGTRVASVTLEEGGAKVTLNLQQDGLGLFTPSLREVLAADPFDAVDFHGRG